MSQRKQRIEHGLRDVLTGLIAREVRDPRVRAATLITVTRVELNVDLSVAMVYVSIIGDDATADGVLAGLAKAAGFLRGPAGRELHLQHAPELRFRRDVSIDMSEKLAAILRDDEDRARAAGRPSEPRDATRGGVNDRALPGQRGRESPLSIDEDRARAAGRPSEEPRDATRSPPSGEAPPSDDGEAQDAPAGDEGPA
jgi:ribosome-binding factor A